MVYANLQLGRDDDASILVAEARQKTGINHGLGGPFAMAAIPARYALERGAWREAAQLSPVETPQPYIPAMTVFARAIGAARSGDAAAAEKDVQDLGRRVEALKAAKNGYWATQVEAQRLAAAAWIDYIKGDRDAALEIMREAAVLEDSSEKSAVTPGRILPARELLGDMLLESGHPAEALVEYEASQLRDPRRFRSLYGAGQAAAQMGNRDKARYFYGKLVEMTGPGGTRPELATARAYLASN